MDRSPTGANGQPAMQTAHGYIPRGAPKISGTMAMAKAMNIRMSVKKLNLVAKLVRRMHVDDALIQLTLVQKKAARILTKVRPEIFLSVRARIHACMYPCMHMHFEGAKDGGADVDAGPLSMRALIHARTCMRLDMIHLSACTLSKAARILNKVRWAPFCIRERNHTLQIEHLMVRIGLCRRTRHAP